MCLSLCPSMTQAVGAETTPGSQLLLMCAEVIGKLRLMKGGKKRAMVGKVLEIWKTVRREERDGKSLLTFCLMTNRHSTMSPGITSLLHCHPAPRPCPHFAHNFKGAVTLL